MTSARNFRVKGRFWVGFFLVLMVLGFVAIFSSSQSQLDASRQQFIRCEQQQESLNSQLRTLKEHKHKLEKSLESERREHLETKTTLEQQMKEQKDAHGKVSIDAANRYENLQQKYKTLQEQHTTIKEEYAKKKNIQGEEISGLERKAKSLTKESEIWKTKYENSTAENKRLQSLLSTNEYHTKIRKLELELLDYKNHCKYESTLSRDTSLKTESSDHPLNKPVVQKSFSEQKLVSENVYEIQIKSVMGQTTAIPLKSMALLKSFTNQPNGQGVINSVENFQIAPQEIQVIQAPPALKSPSTSSSSTQSSVDKEPSPASIAKRSSASSGSTTPKKKAIPSDLGVAPVPEIPEDPQELKEDDNPNNRYSNVVNELSAKNIGNDGAEEDNGAFEHKDLQEVLDDANPGGGDDLNEEGKRNNDQHGELEDDEMDGLGRNHGAASGKKNKAEHLLDDSLNNEVAGDHGKELQDELRIADDPINEEDEDEDVDDYANHEARQREGQAIRN